MLETALKLALKSTLAGGVAALALLSWSGAAQAQERYTYLHHATPTNVFWQAVKKGMDEACGQIEADCQMVFLQQDGNFQEQLNNLEAVIAQDPDGIIMTFAGGNIFAELLETTRVCSLGQISAALFEVGGEYRRNM